MAFGQDALEELSRELLGGYYLNTRLLALLAGEPLDSRRQEAAVAMLQELSGVLMRSLMASLFLPSSGGSDGAARTPSPEATITEGTVDQRAPAKDKGISGEELTPHTKVGREVVKEDITASPEDAYQWRKYGQKIIQYREFPRVYYRCMYSHGRGCRAKKQVQQRDNSSCRPMYQVTYVNEHTCRQVLPGPSEQPAKAPPTSTPTHRNNGTPWSGHFDHPQNHVVDGNGAESENKIMTCGAPSPSALPWPPVLESSQPVDKPDVAHSWSQVDVNMDLDEPFALPLPSVQTPAAPCSSVPPPLPVQVSPSDLESYMLPLGGQYLPTLDRMTIEKILQLFSPVAAQSISQCCGDDMPVAVTPFPDSMSAWPQYC